MTDWLFSTAQSATLVLWKGQPPPREPMQDIRGYARLATLPEMPLPPQTRAMSPLDVDIYRCQVVLQDIEAITLGNSTITPFCDRYLTSKPLRYYAKIGKDDTDSDFTVPATGYHVPLWPLGGPTGSKRLLKWVKHYPLSTVLCMVELRFPVSARYVLEEDCDDDRELMRWVTWTNHAGRMAWINSTGLITVFTQPPWVLTQEGLEQFSSCRRFPAREFVMNKPVTEAEGRWAKVWSICARNRSPFFVLTNYHGWVFGAFERSSRAAAWVSQVVPWDAKDPTVIECLFYWFVSALAQRRWCEGVFTKLGLPEVWPDDDEMMDEWERARERLPNESEEGEVFRAASSPFADGATRVWFAGPEQPW
ncbi:hypothetical protein C8T65DRAFT_202632 [Cerioporus squamosus]|nr:hypothetical protein C8T65DRAFT_202632 [Cerioporus squamosus]